MKKPLNVIFLGLSGSGKGTQVELLRKKMEQQWPMKVIVTGDLFRDLAKHDTDVGNCIKAIFEQGGLPFDDLATTMWMHEIAYTVHENEGIMCDGFPRREEEAKNLDRFLEFLNRLARTRVIYLHVSSEEVQRRMLARGRFDDTEQAITGRITYFHERVIPVVDYYREQKRLIEVNGEQSPEQVHENIVKALEL
jgi:adenylate kinase